MGKRRGVKRKGSRAESLAEIVLRYKFLHVPQGNIERIVQVLIKLVWIDAHLDGVM